MKTSLGCTGLRMKVSVYGQRYRQIGVMFMYTAVIMACLLVLYDPSYLDGLLKVFIDHQTAAPAPTRFPPSTPLPRRTLKKLINLPFTPKNFRCEDMLQDSGTNFTYLESYWDHLDAYKTALSLNNMLALSTSNEQDWILQEISRLPFVQTICEAGFGAGATTFQWLAGNDDVTVYSFDEIKQNYSLEMVDFMSIEFPERFYLYPGDMMKTVKAFVQKREGHLKCDVVFVDSSLPTDVIRENIKDFKRLANRMENLVVMNAHPHNLPGTDAHSVWTEFTGSGEVIEHFKCFFSDDGNVGKNTGMTVGSYAF